MFGVNSFYIEIREVAHYMSILSQIPWKNEKEGAVVATPSSL
jgi:hypothetical protein